MFDTQEIERLKELFVTRQECQDNLEGVTKKFANDDKRLAVIETYQRITLGVLAAVGAGVLTIVLNIFSGGLS